MRSTKLVGSSRGARMKRLAAMAIIGCLSTGAYGVVQAPDVLENTKPFDSRGELLPIDALVRDASGVDRPLGDSFMEGKPALLTFNYLGCAMLCSLQQDGLARTLDDLELVAGKDFSLLTVSIDPKESPELAQRASERMSSKVGGEWSIFTASAESISRLTKAAGFNFEYVEREKQYAHPAVTYVLTPEGRVSQYLTGLEPKERDLKFALIEASEGQIGSFIDQMALACLQYDTSANAYVARGVMQAGGVAILTGLGAFLGILWMRERRRWD